MKIISGNVDDPNVKTIKLKLSIIDNGVGISKEGLKKLFTAFGKLDENN